MHSMCLLPKPFVWHSAHKLITIEFASLNAMKLWQRGLARFKKNAWSSSIDTFDDVYSCMLWLTKIGWIISLDEFPHNSSLELTLIQLVKLLQLWIQVSTPSFCDHRIYKFILWLSITGQLNWIALGTALNRCWLCLTEMHLMDQSKYHTYDEMQIITDRMEFLSSYIFNGKRSMQSPDVNRDPCVCDLDSCKIELNSAIAQAHQLTVESYFFVGFTSG